MVHTSKNKTLGRKAASRKALFVSQSNALIKQKRIITTLAKAKALKKFVAPIITGARKRIKSDVNHAYRQAFSLLRDKKSTHILFNEVLPQIKERPGGYTRIIKLGAFRKGDAAPKALIELVDFNALLQKKQKSKTRRGRRKKVEQTLFPGKTGQQEKHGEDASKKETPQNITPSSEEVPQEPTSLSTEEKGKKNEKTGGEKA